MNKNYGISITHTVGWRVVNELPTPKYKASIQTSQEQDRITRISGGYTPEEIRKIAFPLLNSDSDRVAHIKSLNIKKQIVEINPIEEALDDK